MTFPQETGGMKSPVWMPSDGMSGMNGTNTDTPVWMPSDGMSGMNGMSGDTPVWMPSDGMSGMNGMSGDTPVWMPSDGMSGMGMGDYADDGSYWPDNGDGSWPMPQTNPIPSCACSNTNVTTVNNSNNDVWNQQMSGEQMSGEQMSGERMYRHSNPLTSGIKDIETKEPPRIIPRITGYPMAQYRPLR
jgi:hypothetical protein